MELLHRNIDYDRPVRLAEGVFWVGFADQKGRLQSNPYLIVDGDEAILIDGGSRPDFSTVMRKILQAGIAPAQISYLIYQHYDPDLCGSVSNLESIIDRPDLKIVSHAANNPFIRHYSVTAEMLCMDQLGGELVLKSGRRLRFYRTPYAHSAGSFVTYDEATGILFSSDIFGSTGAFTNWRLFANFSHHCVNCENVWPDDPDAECPTIKSPCPWSGLHSFHRRVMPNSKALHYAMRVIKPINPQMVAPQHGSVLYRKEDIDVAISRLEAMDDIGIDGLDAAAG